MIHIAFAPDDNYVMPTTVAMASLLKNEIKKVCIYILFIEGNLQEENKYILQNTADKFDTKIKFIEVKKEKLKEFPSFRHGLSAYLRILAPQLLADVDKLLYLDGDLIVDKSVKALYDIDISEYQLAAVADLKPFFSPNYTELIGYHFNHPYFNTGILLMNLKALREINLQEQVKKYLKTYKELIYHEDQDILNCTCSKVFNLEPKYNSIIHLWNKNIVLCRQLWTEEQIKEAKESPVIIHYLGGLKPWKYEIRHPFKRKWYNYVNNTSFKGYKPDRTFRKILSLIKSKITVDFK